MDTILLYITDTLPNLALTSLQFEAFRYAIGTLGVFFGIWIILAPFLKNRRIRVAASPSKQINQIKKELINSFRTICIFVMLDIVIFDLADVGVFKTYSDVNKYGITWLVVSVPLGIILHDAYFYWVHRAMHHKSLFKIFHRTHHQSNNPTPFTAYSFAPGEAVVMYAFIPLLMLVIPMHHGAISIILLVMIFKNAIGHCGYELFPKNTTRIPVLRLNTTVTHHDMHHERANGNYGFYFTWWDQWMNTEHSDYLERFENQFKTL